jgi:hypothetical protein
MLRDKKRYFRILLFYLLTYDEFEFENLYSTKLDNKVHLFGLHTFYFQNHINKLFPTTKQNT